MLENDELNYEQKIYFRETLIDISKQIVSQLDTEKLLETIMLVFLGQLSVSSAAIFVPKSPVDETFVIRASEGMLETKKKRFKLKKGSPILNFLMEQKSVITADVLDIAGFTKFADFLKDIKINRVVPLYVKTDIFGVLLLGPKMFENTISDEEENYFILNLANLIGIALSNAFFYELATIDIKTGLLVHHYFMIRMKEHMERSRRHGIALTLLMLDIDHFKKVNDTYGHEAGDKILKSTAEIIIKNVRTIDCPARYGGEEFTVILPDTDIDAALIVAERLRIKIQNKIVKYRRKKLSVTISIGVSKYDQNSMIEVSDFIASADKALYEAKAAGRNCVKLYKKDSI